MEEDLAQTLAAYARSVRLKDGEWSENRETGLRHNYFGGKCRGLLTLIKVSRPEDQFWLGCNECGTPVKLKLSEVE